MKNEYPFDKFSISRRYASYYLYRMRHNLINSYNKYLSNGGRRLGHLEYNIKSLDFALSFIEKENLVEIVQCKDCKHWSSK